MLTDASAAAGVGASQGYGDAIGVTLWPGASWPIALLATLKPRVARWRLAGPGVEAPHHERSLVAVAFNHCIIFAKDHRESATFFTRLFDLPEPIEWGPFLSVRLDGGVVIQYAAPEIEVQPQHYAFLVSEEEFDAIYQRIVTAGLEHWADPRGEQPGTFNTNFGGRGVYFRDPAGHGLEVLTKADSAGE